MQIAQINRTDPEAAWIVATNSDGQTIAKNHPVFKILALENTASVSTNEYASRASVAGNINADGVGNFVGLADEDIANGDTGLVKVYGYHESCLIMRIVGSVTVVPGHSMGPGDARAANSLGVSSTGTMFFPFGPIVALDTVTATMHSLGTVGANYCNHVLIRAA